MTPNAMKHAINLAISQYFSQQSAPKETAPKMGRTKGLHPMHFKSGTPSGQFNRNLLPPPLAYYEQQQAMHLRGRGPWRMTRCPFHDDAHASLSVNVENGAFVCHACQAKGGDVLAFQRLLSGQSFREAATMLGAMSHD